MPFVIINIQKKKFGENIKSRNRIAQENEMLSIITDENGNPISKEEFEKMNREHLVLLLQGYIKKMTYLHEDDKLVLSFLANSLLRSFKDSK